MSILTIFIFLMFGISYYISTLGIKTYVIDEYFIKEHMRNGSIFKYARLRAYHSNGYYLTIHCKRVNYQVKNKIYSDMSALTIERIENDICNMLDIEPGGLSHTINRKDTVTFTVTKK